MGIHQAGELSRLGQDILSQQNTMFKITSLEELGIGNQLIADIQPSFDHLAADTYDLKLYGWKEPKRFRAQTNAKLRLDQGTWTVDYLPQQAFSQEAAIGDARSKPRLFSMIQDEVLTHPGFKSLLMAGAGLVKEQFPYATEIRIGIHQMMVVTKDANNPSSNAPEGMHQDGCQFIISAIPFLLENVKEKTAESVIYASDKKTQLWRGQLQLGQAIFMDDMYLWHDVTPVGSKEPGQLTRRGIFGFDFNVV